MQGKAVRLNRILHKGRSVIIPLDHGASDGPIKGLVNMNRTVSDVARAGATAVILHKGIIQSLENVPPCGLIMHLSAGTRLSSDRHGKILVGTVEEAVHLGADGVSVHVNIGGSAEESTMLRALGQVATDCQRFQMPLVAMMYPRGPNISETSDPDNVALVSRVGAELGADIVKTVYTGDPDSFARVVAGCPVPLIIAGGPCGNSNREVLEMVHEALEAGAAGISLGRNVFQHERPGSMVRALRAMVIDNATVEQALTMFE